MCRSTNDIPISGPHETWLACFPVLRGVSDNQWERRQHRSKRRTIQRWQLRLRSFPGKSTTQWFIQTKDREFECSLENSCIFTFLYVLITVQHINETENVSLLTDTVQGNLQKRITIHIIFVTPTVLILINVAIITFTLPYVWHVKRESPSFLS
jgi:hypothetical protein